MKEGFAYLNSSRWCLALAHASIMWRVSRHVVLVVSAKRLLLAWRGGWAFLEAGWANRRD